MKLLSLLLCGLLAASGCAQNAAPNGYETLLAAGKLILPGENGVPSATEQNLSPAENLRRQRLAVARNAPALKLLREALQQPIEAPVAKTHTDLPSNGYSSLRELARQLVQESDVRAADGDFAGAMESRLDALDMGAAITRRSPLLGMLVGVGIENIGRNKIENVASHLSAASLRAALQRLLAIDARRASYLETLQNEKVESIALNLASLKDPQFKKDLTTPAHRERMGISEADAQAMLAMSPEELETSMTQFFEAVIEREKRPYAESQTIALPPATNLFSNLSRRLFAMAFLRFSYERNVTNHRLLQAALELRALKLESGAYPATFAAPLDPFSDAKPLLYKLDGDKYRLYSIGPDGKDDGGAEIQTLETNPETGIKTVTQRLTSESRGDIVAPVF